MSDLRQGNVATSSMASGSMRKEPSLVLLLAADLCVHIRMSRAAVECELVI